MSLSTYLVVGGLLLDIGGAFGIAIPDFPRLRTAFRLGRLDKGLQIAEEGTLEPSDTGFDDVSDLLRKVESPDGHEYIKEGYTAKKIQYETCSGPVFGDSPVSRNICVYFEESYDREENPERKQRHNIGDVRRAVHNEIDRQELRIRALGFAALIAGFGLQICAQFI